MWGGLLRSSVTGQAIRSGPAHSKSVPANAATTPGVSSALDTSTPLTRACANGLRTRDIHSIPGTDRSSVYLPRPVRSSGSSLRRIDCPTYVSVVAISIPPQAFAPDIWPAASRIDSTMFWYPVHRQRFPSRDSRTSASVGAGFSFR